MAKVKAAKRVRTYTRGGGTGKVPARSTSNRAFYGQRKLGGETKSAPRKGGKGGSGGRGH